MSAKSYAESAKSSSTASSSSALTPQSNDPQQYPPIIPKPQLSSQAARAKKSDLANKALAVVAANTPPNGNVWATRIQNSQAQQQQQGQRPGEKEREKLKDKGDEDYDPFVVRQFNHPPVRISVNGTAGQESWPAIGGKASQDKEKERVKWPPSKQPTPPQLSNQPIPSHQNPSSNMPLTANPVTNSSNPSPSVPPQAPVSSPPSTNTQASQKQKYTFGSIDTKAPSRHKQQTDATQTRSQESGKSKKKGSKKDGKGKEDNKANGGDTQKGEESLAAPSEQPVPSPSLHTGGLTPSTLAGKKPGPREKSKEKLLASTRGILVGGGEEEEGATEGHSIKWRFMVDVEDEGSAKGSRTPIASGSLSPLVMDPHLTALKSTHNSTPSLSPVVLAQAIGAISLESNATPPGISPIPSPMPTHPDASVAGASQPRPQDEREPPSATSSDAFEVRDFGYGFGGMDPEAIRRSHEERLADMERAQFERQRPSEITDSYSPHRYPAPELVDPSGPRGYRRGYGSRGYHDGRGGRRGMGMGGGRGSRGMRYSRPSSMHLSHSPISPSSAHLDLNNPYSYQSPVPPYGYPMSFYPPPPGTYEYGTYYGYPPPHSPASYSPSQYHPPPPQFDVPYPPPPTSIDQAQPFPAPITRLAFPLDHLRYCLLGQLEYYLSPDNVVHDFYLRQKMDSLGYIPISLIASFNRVKRLTPSVELVKEVLLLSSVAEVKDDFVRMVSWQQWILPDAATSTVGNPAPAGNEDEEEEEVVFVMESAEAGNNNNGQSN